MRVEGASWVAVLFPSAMPLKVLLLGALAELACEWWMPASWGTSSCWQTTPQEASKQTALRAATCCGARGSCAANSASTLASPAYRRSSRYGQCLFSCYHLLLRDLTSPVTSSRRGWLDAAAGAGCPFARAHCGVLTRGDEVK